VIPTETCVLIDTDFDLDDMMAIPVVMGSSNVKAIVNSEGYTLAPEGASALSRFVAEPSKPLPAIIVGASYPGTRDIKKWAWLPDGRESMHNVNGLLIKPLTPKTKSTRNYTVEVTKAMATCKSISVLVIGTFTSFVEYSPVIRDRINSVVMQGRPYLSDKYKNPKLSFNCEYDIDSCQKAFEQLKGLNPVWVDVPRETVPPYSPTLDMVSRLDNDGLPGTLKAALMANQKLWVLDFLSQGNHSFLWDQLAALYILHPSAFHLVDGHMEPNCPPSEIQRLWTEAVNKNNH
jgi:inosine-uridine nucleoside N-ribohydrolase